MADPGGETEDMQPELSVASASIATFISDSSNSMKSADDMDQKGYDGDDDDDGAILSNEITVQFNQCEKEIFSAVRANYITRLCQLVTNGHDVNQLCKTDANAKPTIVQVRMGDGEETITIKSVQMTGYAPLHVAAIHSSLQTVKCLLSLGVDVNVRDRNERTPLQNAVTVGRYRVASLLIQAGADVNTQSCSMKTPLFEAITIERLDLVELLLRHGADPDLADLKGATPLSKAVMQSASPTGSATMPPIIQALIDAGCEVDKPNTGGATSLMLSAGFAQNNDIILKLLRAGANVNHLDNAGNNVFNLCASQGQRNLTAIKTLMLHGAATNFPNNKGETPLSKCLKYGSISVLRLLLQADAVPHSQDILAAPRIDQVRKLVPDFDAFLLQEFFQPRSLLRLCREVIRNSLSPNNLPRIASLELPQSLCNFVLGDFLA